MPNPWLNWISPIALQIGPVAIHWYGVMYLLTFIISYLFLKYHRLGKALPLDESQKDNLLISIILGIILGGRLGYILFYNLPYYLQNPGKIIALWEGGLSFHGGMIGSAVAIALYIHFHHRLHRKKGTTSTLTFLQIGDIAGLVAPLGLTLVRLGNFINAELVGRISPDGRFCLYFPSDPANCRYPSQLFESAGEGLFLFLILYMLTRRTSITKHTGYLSAAFLTFYGMIRIFLEYFREPDPQVGYLVGGPGFLAGLSLGQLLSVLTVLAGIIMFTWLRKKKHKN